MSAPDCGFWEKSGGVERTGMFVLVGAAWAALVLAVVVSLFSDNIRLLLAQCSGGGAVVERRVSRSENTSRHIRPPGNPRYRGGLAPSF